MPSRRTDRRPERGWGRFPLVACLLLLTLLPFSPADAQEQAGPSPAVTEQEIDALVGTLEDPAAREKLVQQLRALKAAQAREAQAVEPEGVGAMLLASLSEQVRQVSDVLATAATAALDLPQLIGWTVAQLSNPAVRDRLLEVLLKLGIILAAALAAEWLTRRLLRHPLRALEIRGGVSFWLRLPLAVARLLLELLPIAAFAAVAYAVLPATKPLQVTRLVALVIINANVIAHTIGAVARAVLSPQAPGLRLLPVDDETANYIVIWVRRLTVIWVYGYFLAEAALLLGLAPEVHGLLLRAIGLLVAAMLIVLVLQNRTAVRGWLKGRAESGRLIGLRHRIAEVWHILGIAYIFAVYVVWALDIAGGFQFLMRATIFTIAVVALARLATAGLRRLVARGFALGRELKIRFPGLEARVNRYLPFLETVLLGAVYFLFGVALLEAWGLQAISWLTSDFGRRVFGSLVTIGIILLAAMILSEIVNAAIERYLSRRQNQWQNAERNVRMRTLMPLLRNAFRVLLAVMVALVVLSEVGIDIAPLLAGAGVVGLAIGFGAQTLVKDVINGIFILVEDTIAVGDVVDAGGHAGIVEAMTIRSIRMRDFGGSVHTIPFSAVATVTNMTKDFSYAVFDVRVSYNEDVDRVITVLHDIGAELQADEAFRPLILEPIEVVGVERLEESWVVIRARMKTRPIRQWTIGREFNRRLKQAFDEKGIEIPFPQRTVHHHRDHAPPPGAGPTPIEKVVTD